jgi:hypothetical protein
MRPISRAKHLVLVLSVLGAVVAAPLTLAAPPPGEHDHSHAMAQSSSQGNSSGAMAAMRDMRAMHEKMMAAKTPAERQALMADHMKAMQEGMKTMRHMGSCCGATGSLKSMSMRMDMMTMMLQMMMDRQQMMGGMGMQGMMGHSSSAAPGRAESRPPR